MKIINTNSIARKLFWALGILAILAFGFISLPKSAAAASYATYKTYQVGGGYGNSISEPAYIPENPEPRISSINPRSSNVGVGTKTITITGGGFTPNSVVRINGVNRTATFIDSSHMLVQITGNDTYAYRTNGGFYVTVFNGAPGGGYSNAAFFTVVDTTGSPTSNGDAYNPNSANTGDNFTDTVPARNPQNAKDLTSNAIFGSNSFLPSGLISWVLLAIIILLVIIIVRKVFGAEQKYHESPLKHH